MRDAALSTGNGVRREGFVLESRERFLSDVWMVRVGKEKGFGIREGKLFVTFA